MARARPYHLTLLCDSDRPWVDDPVRYLPGKGREFFDACRAELELAQRRYMVIRGGWAQRESAAVAAVEALPEEPIDLSAWP